MASIFEKLGNTDRRIIFILIALAVIIPIITHLTFPNPVGAEPSRDMYEYVDAMPSGCNVLLSFDYDPSTMPELQPMAVAIVTHLMNKDINIVGMALWPQGASLGQEVMSSVADSLGKVQYEDWCNLGYKTGGGIMIVRLGSSMSAVFPTDRDNLPWEEIPMLEYISDLSSFDLVISLSAGDPGIPAWVMMAGDRFGVPVGGGCTAVSAPQFYTYLQTGQMVGMLGGLKGAADYETLVGIEGGPAVRGMAPQSVAHLVIMLFIVIGNVAYLSEKKKGGRG
ncbi:MAG: hypothetical protein KAR44_11720 [Candidatus Aegiribacteria sp.]|nr:hypothetical protein [Candidatus Aegiribacteria sp.]